MGHTGIGAGNDDGIKGQALAAVFIEAVDQLRRKLLFRHALADAAADLRKGAIRDLLGLDHPLQLPRLLGGAECVDPLLRWDEFRVEPGGEAVQLRNGQICLLKAQGRDAEVGNVPVQLSKEVPAEVDDLKVMDIVLCRFDIAAVGEVPGAVLAHNGVALGNVELRRVHTAVAGGQKQTLNLIIQNGTVFFQIFQSCTLLFLAMASTGTSSRWRSFSQMV